MLLRKLLPQVVLLFSLIQAWGQTNPPSHQLMFRYQLAAELADDNTNTASIAYKYTYIGRYLDAMQTYELPLRWGFDTLPLLQPKAYTLIEAVPYIAGAARNHQMIIISEAHQKPQHRILTTLLLDTLYKEGYRHLGIEALNNLEGLKDTLLQQRGYALMSPQTGTYTQEVCMGRMIRHALKLGYQLFAYERAIAGERDSIQAQNIISYRKQHPDGKMIIHAGWYHAIESEYPKRRDDRWMAYHYKQLTGDDPLTIYQDMLSEKILESESPIYQQLQSEQISILVDTLGKPWQAPAGEQHVDLFVYHPRTRYQHGRPHWLFFDPAVRAVDFPADQVKINYPIRCSAIPQGEDPRATPQDRVELTHRYIPMMLALPPGNYDLYLENPAGAQQKLVLTVP